MKYLEKAFNFFGKYYLLAIPLFIAIVIPSIIGVALGLPQKTKELSDLITQNPAMFQSNPWEYMGVSQSLFPIYGIMSVASFILMIIAYPSTYGMVSKALSTGNADLGDFLPELKKNIGKYILYGLSLLAIYFGIGIAATILFVILGVVTVASRVIGILLIVLFVLAFIAFLLAFAFLTALWFASMVDDGLGVVDGFKKSFSVAKSYFWSIVGISLLVWIGSAFGGGILSGIFSFIPVISYTFSSGVSALAQFILIVFYFEVYRDKTGKNDYMVENQNPISETPGDYL
ncbi:DUF7847 domain-containing protein [Acetivibrio cellulolyticus]|uniref:DUF7847 domain-containing protein n=1 Tax=Acetivibrio cellulolyticus TaxID=35830 RepID=UPI0001E2CCCE|nr:hypothetical protein [Acetivibrio cellulolyticus]